MENNERVNHSDGQPMEKGYQPTRSSNNEKRDGDKSKNPDNTQAYKKPPKKK